MRTSLLYWAFVGHTFSAVSKVAYINFSFFPLFFVGSKREIVEPICFFSYTVSLAIPCLECQVWHWWKKTVLLSIESNGSKNWLMIIRGASEMHTTNKSETCFKKKTRVAIVDSYLNHIWIMFESCFNYIWTILESYLNHTWIVSES